LGLNVPATNIQENEVVFGGLDRLREEILNTIKLMSGQLYFVLTGCLPEVIGDDVEALVAELTSRKNPLVMASVAGFKGDSYHGYEEVLKTLIHKVIKPSASQEKDLVNVWGIPPTQSPFWRGDLEGLKELLGLLGLKANFFFGPTADFPSLTRAASASHNIVVSGLYGLEAAELFQNKFGVPYVQTPLPLGAAASDRFLTLVGQALKIPSRTVKKAIREAGQRHYAYLEPLVDVFNDMESQRHVLIVGEVNYALALTDFFAEDLGWIPELTVIVNQLEPESQAQVLNYHAAMGGTRPEKLIFANQSQIIAAEAKAIWEPPATKYHLNRQPIFVAASSLERSLAQQLGGAHLSLTYPIANRAILSRGYVGYAGGLRLTEDTVSAFIAGR
jgi:nitrogenase molybdenum-iron protein beta chain